MQPKDGGEDDKHRHGCDDDDYQTPDTLAEHSCQTNTRKYPHREALRYLNTHAT